LLLMVRVVFSTPAIHQKGACVNLLGATPELSAGIRAVNRSLAQALQ
jgi:hypothetical protein